MEIFSEITGHTHQKNLLIKLLLSGRIPHLMLFSGPESIGKFSVAMEFAKSLLCKSDKYYCGDCEICRQPFDLHIIEREGSFIRIDQLRDMQATAEEGPYRADRSVFIIRDAEYMNEEAMNSSLRTLEEPYEHVNIILLAQNKSKLLPTIISRCFQIDFFSLKEEEIRTILIRRLGFSPQKAGEYLGISDKSLEFADKLESDLFISLYKDGTYPLFKDIISDCSMITISRVLDAVGRKDIILFLKLFLNFAQKEMSSLLGSMGDRYNLMVGLLIDSLGDYESYNLNDSVFIESFLLKMKGVLENVCNTTG